MKEGWLLIAEERKRQREEECFGHEHDDTEHPYGQLAGAAACYAWMHANYLGSWAWRLVMACWPWETEWWKPKDPIRDLVRAGALLAAEIDRLQRRAQEQEKSKLIILP